MPLLYDLLVVSPDRVVYQGKAQSLVAPGVEGSFGVLPHHAPMVAELDTGELDVVSEQGARISFALSGGLLEVTWNAVTVFADSAEAAADIDIGRARAAESRAQERLHSRSADLDFVRAQAALKRALNRLRVAARSHPQTPPPSQS